MFTYISKNGNVLHKSVTNDTLLREFKFYEYGVLDDITLVSYEGATDCQLLSSSLINSYFTLNDSLMNITVDDNDKHTYTINVPKFDFDNWKYTFAYLDTNKQSNKCNVGFLYDKRSIYDFDGEGAVNSSYLYDAILNYIIGEHYKIPGYPNVDWVPRTCDFNGDGIVDVTDATDFITFYSNGIRNITPIINEDSVNNLSLTFANKNNVYRLLTPNYYIQIHKICVNTKVEIKYGDNESVTYSTFQYLNPASDITIMGDDVPTKLFDLSNNIYGSANEFEVTISTTLGVYPKAYADANQDIKKNFSLDLLTQSLWVEDPKTKTLYPGFSDVSTVTTEGIEPSISTSFKITRSEWVINDDADKERLTDYYIKLNRKPVGQYSSEYWEAMGFKDAIAKYRIRFENKEIALDKITIPNNIILFTNVSNNDSSHSITYKYLLVDKNVISIDNVENIIIDGTNDDDLTITREIIGDHAYLVFTPKYNTSINNEITFEATAEHHEDNKKKFNVKLISLSMEPSVTKLHYIKDISNSDKILYEELLLSKNSTHTVVYDDNIWFNKFCGEMIIGDNLLNDYKFDDSGVIFTINSGDNSATNVPDGIKLKFNLTNMIYYKSERVLLPTSMSNVNYTLTNEYASNDNRIIFTHDISMTELSVDNNEKLFTNGKRI